MTSNHANLSLHGDAVFQVNELQMILNNFHKQNS